MEYLACNSEVFSKLKKDELLNVIKKLRDYSNNELKSFMDEIRSEMTSLKKQIESLSAENIELKELICQEKENKKKTKDLELILHDTAQYVRRNNIEICNIPEIFNENLEDKVIEICKLYGVDVTSDDIEACHRLPKGKIKQVPATTIVRFVNRKNVERLLDNRKKEVDLENLGFPKDAKAYFNENLCPYYRHLWFKCRRLKQAGIVKYVWSGNGIVRIRRDDNSPAVKILHNDDLLEHFPDFHF